MIVLWLLIAIAAAIAICMLPQLIAAKNSRLECSIKLREEFERAAKPLLNDDEVPEIALCMVEVLGQELSKPDLARNILWSGLTGRTQNFSKNPPPEMQKDFAAIDAMRPELQKALSRVCAAALIGSSYRSLIAGAVLRRLMLWDIERRTETAMDLVVEQSTSHSKRELAQAA